MLRKSLILRFTASQNLVNLPILFFAGITQYMVLFSPPLRHIVYFENFPAFGGFCTEAILWQRDLTLTIPSALSVRLCRKAATIEFKAI